jgi:hypothetical protein
MIGEGRVARKGERKKSRGEEKGAAKSEERREKRERREWSRIEDVKRYTCCAESQCNRFCDRFAIALLVHCNCLAITLY